MPLSRFFSQTQVDEAGGITRLDSSATESTVYNNKEHDLRSKVRTHSIAIRGYLIATLFAKYFSVNTRSGY
jgi:hypothetical protein